MQVSSSSIVPVSSSSSATGTMKDTCIASKAFFAHSSGYSSSSLLEQVEEAVELAHALARRHVDVQTVLLVRLFVRAASISLGRRRLRVQHAVQLKPVALATQELLLSFLCTCTEGACSCSF